MRGYGTEADQDCIAARCRMGWRHGGRWAYLRTPCTLPGWIFVCLRCFLEALLVVITDQLHVISGIASLPCLHPQSLSWITEALHSFPEAFLVIINLMCLLCIVSILPPGSNLSRLLWALLVVIQYSTESQMPGQFGILSSLPPDELAHLPF